MNDIIIIYRKKGRKELTYYVKYAFSYYQFPRKKKEQINVIKKSFNEIIPLDCRLIGFQMPVTKWKEVLL